MNKINHIIRRHNSCFPKENAIIFNKSFRLCKYCKHLDYNNEKCKKFGEHVITNGKYNVVLGKYEHLPADVCRRDETKCGESAVFYEEMTKIESDGKKVFKKKEPFNTLDEAILEAKRMNCKESTIHKLFAYKFIKIL